MPTPKAPTDRKPKKAADSQKASAATAAARTRSAAARAAVTDVVTDVYAPTTWGTINLAEDIVCPSGQRALVKRPGVEGLILAGALEEMDSLSAIVDQKHIKRVEGKGEEVDVKSLMADAEQLQRVISVADRIVAYVVIKPPISLAPADEADREDGVIYTDMIDLNDRMFIMNFAVGGTRDLEQFRVESAEAMGSLVDGEEVLVSSEQSVRDH